MKTFIKYFLPVVLITMLTACGDDFLTIDPQDKLTVDNFYKSEAEIKAATAALYGFPWFEFNDKFFWCAGDAMAGDMYHTFDQEGQFFYFSFGAGNAHLSAAWKSLFRVVSYANAIINDMPRVATGKVPDAVINEALGESRFIRAMAYYHLAEFWGDVPIVENSTELVSSNNLILPKNTRRSVYEFIRRDLVFASENLPLEDVPGRVTQWSAKAMLAKLHLTMAQHISDGASAENFNKARTYAQDVINNGPYALQANYADIFSIDNNNNSESIFALQWMEGNYAIGNSRQANWARSSIITGNSEAWGGGKSATYDFTQAVEHGDKRQPAIYMQLGDHYDNINKANGGYTYLIVSRDPADPNVILENASPVLNNLKKYVVGSAEDTNGKVSTGQAVALNQIMLRLADVYLISAEATLGAQTSTTDATALAHFNAIRTRAGLSEKSSLTFADILKERRVEFGLESINWFDIKRYYYRDANAALDYLNGQERLHSYFRLTTPNPPDENTVEGYELAPPSFTLTINAEHMFLPVPAAEVVVNPLLGPDEAAVDYQF